MAYDLTTANEKEKSHIRRKLIEFNAEHVPLHLSQYDEINLAIKDENGKVAGGMIAVVCWNWMEIGILWVDSDCRKKGLGTQLLSRAESIAKEKGCTFIKLNTFSFQAPGFYLKNGFTPYAILENAPLGSKHYYFKKDLHK